MVIVPYRVVEKIIEWNAADETRGNEEYDRKVCLMLLMSLTSKEEVRASKISKEVIEFIKACFVVRCGDEQKERIDAINKYIEELCAKKATEETKTTEESE